jgi:hypothetical protein
VEFEVLAEVTVMYNAVFWKVVAYSDKVHRRTVSSFRVKGGIGRYLCTKQHSDTTQNGSNNFPLTHVSTTTSAEACTKRDLKI